jgi:hypothetical protein
MIIVIFLFIGVFFIISQHHLNVSDSKDLTAFASYYGEWLGNTFHNSVRTAGYAVKLDWLPKNSS